MQELQHKHPCPIEFIGIYACKAAHMKVVNSPLPHDETLTTDLSLSQKRLDYINLFDTYIPKLQIGH
jgi:hypothetical protein